MEENSSTQLQYLLRRILKLEANTFSTFPTTPSFSFVKVNLAI